MSRPSLAVILVVLGNPGVRGDVRMAGFSRTASLDEVCDVLSAGSDSRRRALRTNALRALGRYMTRSFTNLTDCVYWLDLVHKGLCAWASICIARDALYAGPTPLAEAYFARAERSIAGVALASLQGDVSVHRWLFDWVDEIVLYTDGDDEDRRAAIRTIIKHAGPSSSVQTVAERMVLFPEWVGTRPDNWELPRRRLRR